ncbi:MAG: hypothetical protein LBT23_10470, partial [Synergistaceae bacterium]|nr:hypothetical protein [Synergistaceae bacterium]
MADETKIIQVNKGTTDQWANAVRPLKSGEFGYDITNKEVKVGDGATSFPNLKALVTGDNILVNLPFASDVDIAAGTATDK